MRQYRALARASAIKVANFSALAVASVARNFLGVMLSKKGTIEVNFFALAKASVARNLSGIYFLTKGTVK